MEREDPDLHVLLSERVLKDLFLSRWYSSAHDALELTPSARDVLDAVAEESAAEQQNAEAALAEWRDRMGAEEVEALQMLEGEMLHAARQGYLRVLIEAKDASAVFFQKAALMAPKDLSDRLAQLGARDFEHSMRLHRLLTDLFYTESPGPVMLTTGEGPKP